MIHPLQAIEILDEGQMFFYFKNHPIIPRRLKQFKKGTRTRVQLERIADALNQQINYAEQNVSRKPNLKK